jgi:phosphoserine phosphatase
MRANCPAAWSEIVAEGVTLDPARGDRCASRRTDADRRPPGAPRLFVSDMDSTMISAECIDELADFAGLKPQIAAITERAMQGELDFREALTERVGC